MRARASLAQLLISVVLSSSVAMAAADTVATPSLADECAEMQAAMRADLIGEKDRVLLLFWAKWSGPDKILIKSLDTELPKDQHPWVLRRVDVDDEGTIATACNVRAVPTLIPIIRGRAVDRLVGAVPPDKLRNFLDSLK